jgi:hypothetical protein
MGSGHHTSRGRDVVKGSGVPHVQQHRDVSRTDDGDVDDLVVDPP